MSANLQGTIAVTPVETIRRAFPALERRHEGQPVAYFDGPGGTRPIQRLDDATEKPNHPAH